MMAVESRPERTWAASAMERKVFSYPVLLGMFLVAGANVACRFNLPDADMWWHTAVGERMLTTRAWPALDTYSFSAKGADWIAHEWLGEVVMALAARAAGLAGLMALLTALSVLLVLLLYYFAYQRSHNARAAFVSCFLSLFLLAGFFTLRPQLLGYIFLLITMICVEAFRQGHRKTLWLLPPLFVLWVNTHSTFVLGLVVLGLYWAGGLVSFQMGSLHARRWTADERRQLELVVLLCVIALFLTPYGTQLAVFPMQVEFLLPLNKLVISEWQPLGASGMLLQMLMALLLPFVLAQFVFRQSYRLEELALFLLALCGAFLHSRMIFLFALAFAPLLAKLLSRWMPAYEAAKDHPVYNAVMLLLLAAALARFFPSGHDLEKEVEEKYPRQALEYLRQHPVNGPMLNEYGWGGYLMRTIGPEQKVFIDGRVTLYEYGGVLSDYFQIMGLSRNTLALLRKYNLQACLIRRDAPLATLLAAQPDWQVVYSDQVSTIVIRKRQQQSAKSDHPITSQGPTRAS